MVEISLFQMTLCMQLGMKYTTEITYYTTTKYPCKMMKYKNSIYYIFFKLKNQPFPHITTKEYNSILNAFNVVSSIYDNYKPKGRKSFLHYPFVLKQILITLRKIQYTKYIPPLKTHSKQKELE